MSHGGLALASLLRSAFPNLKIRNSSIVSSIALESQYIGTSIGVPIWLEREVRWFGQKRGSIKIRSLESFGGGDLRLQFLEGIRWERRIGWETLREIYTECHSVCLHLTRTTTTEFQRSYRRPQFYTGRIEGKTKKRQGNKPCTTRFNPCFLLIYRLASDENLCIS